MKVEPDAEMIPLKGTWCSRTERQVPCLNWWEGKQQPTKTEMKGFMGLGGLTIALEWQKGHPKPGCLSMFGTVLAWISYTEKTADTSRLSIWISRAGGGVHQDGDPFQGTESQSKPGT